MPWSSGVRLQRIAVQCRRQSLHRSSGCRLVSVAFLCHENDKRSVPGLPAVRERTVFMCAVIDPVHGLRNIGALLWTLIDFGVPDYSAGAASARRSSRDPVIVAENSIV